MTSRLYSRHAVFFAPLVAALTLLGCDDDALQPNTLDGGKAPGGLTQQQAQSVVAKVGEVTITLGDFAASLERMNQFDRLRYQTKQRRRDHLDEIIDVELLAQEAVRRGLDARPDVREAIRQILRDAMMAEAQKGVPAPAAIPAAEVAAYYEKHKEDFREPERRRVSVIVMGDPDKAAEVLAAAKNIETGAQWGELYFEHSLNAPTEKNPNAPADLAGDLGIVGPPGEEKGANKNVPQSVRGAVFKIKDIGGVADQLVMFGGKHYIVRLAGLSKGHLRSLEEADRSIRVAIMQEKRNERRAQLLAELRKKFPVVIDDAALAEVKLPKALADYKPFWEEEPEPEPESGPAPVPEEKK